MSRFLDEKLRGLEPYTPGEQPKIKNLLKLNTNENPFPPSPLVLTRVAEEARNLQLYPDPTNADLAAITARTYGVQPENVFLANGSDEVLAFIFQALCPRGVAFPDISYGFYSVYANRYGVEADIVPLREDYSLAAEDYYGLEKTIVIANPNAPTGMSISAAEVEGILRQNPGSLVVIDEAYVDFGGESCVPLIGKYENLMVVGTFSKSRSLAGARLGYAISSAPLIGDLELIKYSYNPYNVNRLTAAAGVAALEDSAYFEDCRAKIIASREYTSAALRALGFRVLDSRTNFVFASPPGMGGEKYFKFLRGCGIIVRYFNAPRCTDFVRISIGTREQMERLIAVSRQLLAED